VAGGMEELFRAHWRLVVGYLARRTGSTTVGEELAQETFYCATRAFLGWRGGSPAAWLLAIARNVLIDHTVGADSNSCR
jgi:DNA-directed RNA polymerase specialized sigma24 family protein